MLIAAWSFAVLLLFVWSARSLLGGAVDSLRAAAVVALIVYAAWFMGFRLWERFLAGRLPGAGGLERSVLEFALGAAVSIYAVMGAGFLGLYSPAVCWGLIAVALLGPHGAFWRSLRARRAAAPAGSEPFLLANLLLVGGMTFCASLAPVTAQDALVYHLAVPARYVEVGGIAYLPGNFFAQFPQNIEMLFTLALILDGEAAAQCLHWVLGAGVAAAVAALARALSPRGNGFLAAAAFATIPTAALIGGWAYVDLGVVFYAAASTLCFLRWTEERRGAWLFLAAVCAGVAAGSKYTAGIQGLMVAGGVLVLGAARRLPAGRTLVPAAGVAAVVGLLASPWWIKNAIYTGNPLYPFAYGLFGGGDWDAERAAVLALSLSQWGGERGLLATLLLPWRLTMDGEFFSIEKFDGMIGPVFLLAAPILLASLRLSRGHRIIAVFIVVECLLWSTMTRQVRFLLPALALLAGLLGGSAPALLPAGTIGRAARLGLSAALLVNVVVIALHFAAHSPLPVVLGMEDRDRYLERELPGRDYKVFRAIDRNLPRESFILFGSLGNPGFLCKRRYHSDALFENRTLAAILREARGPDDVLSAFGRRGFTHLLFRWENVFDPSERRSEIPYPDQEKLAAFLNRHGRLLVEAGRTCLYEIAPRVGPQGAGP